MDWIRGSVGDVVIVAWIIATSTEVNSAGWIACFGVKRSVMCDLKTIEREKRLRIHSCCLLR